MLRLLFVIALSLPSFAHEGEHNETVTCSTIEVDNAYNEFLNCFNTEVTNTIKEETKNCSTWLPRSILNFVKAENETCYNGTVKVDRDAVLFYKFLQYSLKIAKFKDFIEMGGAKCINSVKGKINKCVQDEIGDVENSDKYNILWKKTRLTIDPKKSCKEALRIKNCALKEIRSDYNCKYEQNNELYVSSLFQYMLKECTKIKPDWLFPKRPSKEKPQLKDELRTTHVLLGLLITLALLSILYSVIRDCRAPNGRWKTFNEQFSMRQRRRSLVNNECQAN